MYATMEARIKHGKIVPKDPDKLPEEGRLLLVVLDSGPREVNWAKVKTQCGKLRLREDSVKWQTKVRKEWDSKR